jgi:hypothetical protein
MNWDQCRDIKYDTLTQNSIQWKCEIIDHVRKLLWTITISTIEHHHDLFTKFCSLVHYCHIYIYIYIVPVFTFFGESWMQMVINSQITDSFFSLFIKVFLLLNREGRISEIIETLNMILWHKTQSSENAKLLTMFENCYEP